MKSDFFSVSSDRGRVVGGLPDVVTIMEEKVNIFQTRQSTLYIIISCVVKGPVPVPEQEPEKTKEEL